MSIYNKRICLVEGLEFLQSEIAKWENYNFPNTTAIEQFMGVVEEVGELSHFLLKDSQGIREAVDKYGEKLDVKAHVVDAVGDISIFLINFCSHYDINYADALIRTWELVSKRDFRKFPKNGIDL